MKEDEKNLRDKVYDLEMIFEEMSMLINIMKVFGEYCDEVPNGAEKMCFLTNVLDEKRLKFKDKLDEFIPEFQKCFIE